MNSRSYPRYSKALGAWACIAVMGLAALSGCAKSATPQPEVEPLVAPPAISTQGVLKVGVNLGSAPYAVKDGNSYRGFDVELASEIALNLGLSAEFELVAPDEIEDALSAGTVDVVMSAPISSEETSSVGSYLTRGVALYSNSDAAGEITVADLGDAQVAVQEGSPAYWWFSQHGFEDQIAVKSSAAEALEAAERGEVAYAAVDSVVGDYAVAGGAALKRAGWVSEPVELGIALRADNAELFAAIEEQFTTLKDAGWVQALIRRWLEPVASGSSESTESAQ